METEELKRTDETVSVKSGEPSVTPKKKRKASALGKVLAALKEAFAEKRTLKSRLITSGLAAFAFVFTFFIFGPIDIYSGNVTYFAFSFKYMIKPVIAAGLIGAAVLWGILLLLRGRFFTYGVSLVFSLTAAGYIQGNILNIDHGALDGTPIIWGDFKTGMWLGLVFWALMIAVPHIIRYFNRKLWKNVIRFLSALLIIVQAVALFVTVKDTKYSNISDEGYITSQGIYDVPGEGSVVVFLLDRFDKQYADDQFASDPSLAEKFRDFTFYEDFTGSYSRTFPSVTYLLTGVDYEYETSPADYFKRAWSESRFIESLKNEGCGIKIYTELQYVFGNSGNAEGTVDNIGAPTKAADPFKILSAVYNLSAYRYVPEAVKPFYHFYTDDISYGYLYGDSGDVYTVDDAGFRSGFLKKGLNDEAENKKELIFYHLQGAHNPFNMNSDGERIAVTNSDGARFGQVKADLDTVMKYTDELKKLGRYDSTTIIITADHGRTGTMPQLDAERLLTLMIKPAGAANETMLRSKKQVCHDNLRSSIAAYLGADPGDGVRTVEDIGEDEEAVRHFKMSGSDKSHSKRDTNLITYTITGDGSDFENWNIESKMKIRNPFYDANK